ncbi:hypothetical protein KY331_03050 [Candidatus Woesearchaeota archaeon]|nr:hypothetical protein [Candidatus Woesearchaeota archaeon]
MAESEKTTPSRELLEERIRELEEKNRQLEIEVLEGQYRLGEKKKLSQEITLKDYIAKLKSKKPEGKFVLTDVTLDSFCEKYDGWTIFLTCTAGIILPIMWYFIPDLVRHWKYASINLSDNDGNSLGFKYFPLGNSRVLEQLEQNFVGHKVRPVVMSYSYKYRFIKGVMQENGEFQSLDNL